MKFIFSFSSELSIRLHYIRLTALCPGLPRQAGTRKVKPIWILLEQETVSGSGISWAICKSAPHSRQHASTPPLSFLQARCPSCHPTKSVKALKAKTELSIYSIMCTTLPLVLNTVGWALGSRNNFGLQKILA